MLDAAQEAVPMQLTSENPKAIDTERTDGFFNMGNPVTTDGKKEFDINND